MHGTEMVVVQRFVITSLSPDIQPLPINVALTWQLAKGGPLREKGTMSLITSITHVFPCNPLHTGLAHNFVHAQIITGSKRVRAIWVEARIIHSEAATFHFMHTYGLS